MPQTIIANGMTVSHKGTAGYEMNSTPDVCKTPVGSTVVPVPYMIVGKSSDLIRGTKTVFADGGNPIDHKDSAHSKCVGDAAGTLKGIASGTILDESTWITYSPNVYVEGKNIARLGDKMFMNKKNCICGTGAHYEPPASVTDPIMRELCKVFCEARKEWHDCKRNPKRKSCPRPSSIAEGKVNKKLNTPGSKLNKAVKSKFPKGFGAAEKMFFAPSDKIFDGARKIYSQNGLKKALNNKLEKLVKKGIIKKGKKMAAKSWMKIVPGLNVISTIYDVVDTGLMVADIYKAVNAADVMDEAIKVKPDFSIHGEDGVPKKIYDFKFDDPETGYIDDWQQESKQREAYKAATGDKPEKVDNKTCKCPKK